jgi:serine/threonine protein kinase
MERGPGGRKSRATGKQWRKGKSMASDARDARGDVPAENPGSSNAESRGASGEGAGGKTLGGADWVKNFESSTVILDSDDSQVKVTKPPAASVALDLDELGSAVISVEPLEPPKGPPVAAPPVPDTPETTADVTRRVGPPLARPPRARAPSDIHDQDTHLVTGAFGVSEKVEGFKLKPGGMVHKYELVRKLGSGGMGTVWAAHDTSLGRKVAIKFLHGKVSKKKEHRERFLAEARATAQFNHENIVTIYDAGDHAGMSYLVLEFLDGEPLSSRLKNRKIPWSQAVQIMLPVVKALKEAHAVGIIHRDLKPDNIFILRNGGIKVLDFGLAKLCDTEASQDPQSGGYAGIIAQTLTRLDFEPSEESGTSDETSEETRSSAVADGGPGSAAATGPVVATAGPPSGEVSDSGTTGSSTITSGRRRLHDSEHDLTKAGAIMGTYAYMSPEQWGLGEIDDRSDLWAVGVILFDMITGEHPLKSRAAADIMAHMIRPDDPAQSVRELEPGVPEEVAKIIGICLRKDKDLRVKSAKDLLTMLEDVAVAATGRIELKEDQSPYPGLAPFTERDANRFFGRDEEIAQFIGKLKERPMLAVVGSSGAGKSSFVRAGVIPTLRATTSADWDILICRPGRDPFGAVASALLTVATTSITSIESVEDGAKKEAELASELRESPGRLGAILRACSRNANHPLLIYFDQFEELYTLVDDQETRDRFATAVASVAVDPSIPVRVVLSMRSDFLDRVAENPALMEAITRDLTILKQPTTEGLTAAIVSPAALAGYNFEDDAIVHQMVSVLSTETAALPLLQFAAQKLWEDRDRHNRLLTRQAYDDMGGVEGALVRHADAVVGGMPPADLKATRSLFQRMVTPEGTRAMLTIGEILTIFDSEKTARRILQILTDARLLTVQIIGEDQSDALVEVVHESLINRWQTLRHWLDEGHEDAAMLSQLREAARQWENRRRPTGLLWTGDVLDEARLWRRRSTAKLTPAEDAFLNAGFRYATRAQRRKRLLAVSAVVVMALVTVGAIASAFMIRRAEGVAKRAAKKVFQHSRTLQSGMKYSSGKKPLVYGRTGFAEWRKARAENTRPGSSYPRVTRTWKRPSRRPTRNANGRTALLRKPSAPMSGPRTRRRRNERSGKRWNGSWSRKGARSGGFAQCE